MKVNSKPLPDLYKVLCVTKVISILAVYFKSLFLPVGEIWPLFICSPFGVLMHHNKA